MIQIFNRLYENKFTNEVTYFFSIQSYGVKPYFQTVYESVTDYTHYFSKYTIFLSFHPRNKDKIEVEVLRYAPNILINIKSKRKLAVLSKFIFHLIIKNNDVPITKAINRVVYHNNGQDFNLSVNAFLKSYYRLIPRFQKIIQDLK
jgi:hypothetical protein